MEKTVIIVGSSRKNGNTTKIANTIATSQSNIEVVNLSDYNFSYYDYENKNITDGFLPLIKDIIQKYDTIIFATPIYWYSMSGIMKVFFDRLTNLLHLEKDWGRKLRGKKMAVISNSHDSESELDYDFYIPFVKSAEYLGMEYLGNKHFNADNKIELLSLNDLFKV